MKQVGLILFGNAIWNKISTISCLLHLAAYINLLTYHQHTLTSIIINKQDNIIRKYLHVFNIQIKNGNLVSFSNTVTAFSGRLAQW